MAIELLPLKTWATPSDYAVDPIELLRKSGYVRTFRDDVSDFIWDVRVHWQLAAVVGGLGFLAGILGVIVPCLIVMWVAA